VLISFSSLLPFSLPFAYYFTLPLRAECGLQDDSLLEMFEFFEIQSDKVEVIKYSFHWQSDDGKFIKRWDNAAHHPEIETYPHHLHEGAEDFVLPYQPVKFEEILQIVTVNL
jgi:hypothetical protein